MRTRGRRFPGVSVGAFVVPFGSGTIERTFAFAAIETADMAAVERHTMRSRMEPGAIILPALLLLP
jgi:hypothetical protein